MPIREIPIVPTIAFVDHATGQGAGTLTFRQFVVKLFGNPLWNASYEGALAMHAILTALDRALEASAISFQVAESDWAFMKESVEKPRTQALTLIDREKHIIGMRETTGISLPPEYAGQLVPFYAAIMDAKRIDVG